MISGVNLALWLLQSTLSTALPVVWRDCREQNKFVAEVKIQDIRTDKDMAFDPLAKPKYDRATVSRFFGSKSSAKDAQRLKLENPGLYDDMRKSAETEHNLIGQRGYFRAEDLSVLRPGKDARRNYTEAEYSAMAEFSREDCARLFQGIGQEPGAKDNAAAIQKADPEKYFRLKVAARAHGVLPQSTEIHPPVRKPEPPAEPIKFSLEDRIADRIGLPRGHKVDMVEYAGILKAIQIADIAKAEKVAAEKVAVEGDKSLPEAA